MELENGVNIQVNGVAVQMDGGWLHVIVFTQYLCALNAQWGSALVVRGQIF